MQSRTAAAAFILVLLGSVVTIQLADPQLQKRNPPVMDFSESATDVANDAALRLEYVDYEYRTEIQRDAREKWRQVGVVTVEHSEREYRSLGPVGERGSVIYGNDAVAFERTRPSSPWILLRDRGIAYPAEAFTQPFLTQRISRANASLITENETVFVVRINANVQKFADEISGTTIFYIEKRSRMLVRAITTYETTNVSKVRFIVTDRNPSVNRPGDIASSAEEVLWDLARGPITT